MPRTSPTTEQQDLLLEIDRVFEAPRELVWRLWRDPEHMVRWHGPEGCWLTHCDIDFRDAGDGRTRMLFTQSPFISAEERDGHGWGWRSGFDVFDRYVAQFIDEDWRPKGQARVDGVAEDIRAARERAEGDVSATPESHEAQPRKKPAGLHIPRRK